MATAKNFAGRVVLVTGSSSGIGEEIAFQFAKHNAKVVITGRNVDRIKRVAQKCQETSPGKVEPLQVVADLDKEEDTKRLISTIIDDCGHLDVLVNNAATFRTGSDLVGPNAMEIYDQVMRTNLRNTVHLTYLAIPHLTKTKGSIVNISSVASFKPFSNSMAHCMAKTSIDMMTRSLAVDLGPRGIRVNSVNPGQVQTPVYEDLGMTKEQQDQMWKHVSQVYPLRRPCTAEDIAKAVLFLASADASYANGVNMKMDGGFLDTLQFVFE